MPRYMHMSSDRYPCNHPMHFSSQGRIPPKMMKKNVEEDNAHCLMPSNRHSCRNDGRLSSLATFPSIRTATLRPPAHNIRGNEFRDVEWRHIAKSLSSYERTGTPLGLSRQISLDSLWGFTQLEISAAERQNNKSCDLKRD